MVYLFVFKFTFTLVPGIM